jgi:hypothetical protein
MEEIQPEMQLGSATFTLATLRFAVLRYFLSKCPYVFFHAMYFLALYL